MCPCPSEDSGAVLVLVTMVSWESREPGMYAVTLQMRLLLPHLCAVLELPVWCFTALLRSGALPWGSPVKGNFCPLADTPSIPHLCFLVMLT